MSGKNLGNKVHIPRMSISPFVEDIGEGNNIDGIQGLGGPMTRARAKKAEEALNHLVATPFDKGKISQNDTFTSN